jgi:hypothetical protein
MEWRECAGEVVQKAWLGLVVEYGYYVSEFFSLALCVPRAMGKFTMDVPPEYVFLYIFAWFASAWDLYILDATCMAWSIILGVFISLA